MMRRTAIHLGEHLAEQLHVLGTSASVLGRQLKLPTKHVTEILNGHRAVTGDTALRLCTVARRKSVRLRSLHRRTLQGVRRTYAGRQARYLQVSNWVSNARILLIYINVQRPAKPCTPVRFRPPPPSIKYSAAVMHRQSRQEWPRVASCHPGN
jgi:hypothetical protein